MVWMSNHHYILWEQLMYPYITYNRQGDSYHRVAQGWFQLKIWSCTGYLSLGIFYRLLVEAGNYGSLSKVVDFSTKFSLLHTELPTLNWVLAILSAIGLSSGHWAVYLDGWTLCLTLWTAQQMLSLQRNRWHQNYLRTQECEESHPWYWCLKSD